MGVDPELFHEQLIRGLPAGGLEALTERLARTEYPDAHLTGRGPDGGIDVISDDEPKPERAWQCKSSIGSEADWTDCRESIKAAMTGPTPPKHYTFVFNHRLNKSQREFWTNTLLPELRGKYPGVVIDKWDDLARRIEDHPAIIEWLTNGAFGKFIRGTLELTAEQGVNPIANAVDLSDGLKGVAHQAATAGATDPNFYYRFAGGEADASDADIPDGRFRFTMSAGQRDRLPSFKLTAREGDEVTEVSATARNAARVAIEAWFADSPEGIEAREKARTSLARGQGIVLSGPSVGARADRIPDRFTGLLPPDFLADGNGELELGVSEPLVLTLSMQVAQIGRTTERVPIYRVPPHAGHTLAYAGAIGAAIVSLDAVQTGDDDSEWEGSISVRIAVGGFSAAETLKGFAFVKAFEASDDIHVDCDGLLPAGGYDLDTASGQRGDDADELDRMLGGIFLMALALRALEEYDGIPRVVPESADPPDFMRAAIVVRLLREGQITMAVEAGEEFPAPLPPEATPEDELDRWLTFDGELPQLAGYPSLTFTQEVVDATPLRIEPTSAGGLALICQASESGGALVMRLLPSSPNPSAGT